MTAVDRSSRLATWRRRITAAEKSVLSLPMPGSARALGARLPTGCCGRHRIVATASSSCTASSAIPPCAHYWPVWATSYLPGCTTAYRRRRSSAGNRSRRYAGHQRTTRWIKPTNDYGRNGGDDDASAAPRQLRRVRTQPAPLQRTTKACSVPDLEANQISRAFQQTGYAKRSQVLQDSAAAVNIARIVSSNC